MMGRASPQQRLRAEPKFDRFVDFVRDEIGVKLGDTKRTMLESRLRRRIATLGLADFDSYLNWLFDEGALAEEREIIFDAVTTNKTDFFRESEHFDLLSRVCLPEFLASGRQRCKVWSAAASTGLEAYTIAMVLAEAARVTPFDWAVLGTDINTEVLQTARRAIYSADLTQVVPPMLRQRYFLIGHSDFERSVRVAPELRAKVHFQRLNLMDEVYAIDHDVDVIFLRNVLIYFEPADQLRVIDRMAGHLAPGGFLFVGHSESMVVRHPMLTQIAPAVYRRR